MEEPARWRGRLAGIDSEFNSASMSGWSEPRGGLGSWKLQGCKAGKVGSLTCPPGSALFSWTCPACRQPRPAFSSKKRGAALAWQAWQFLAGAWGSGLCFHTGNGPVVKDFGRLCTQERVRCERPPPISRTQKPRFHGLYLRITLGTVESVEEVSLEHSSCDGTRVLTAWRNSSLSLPFLGVALTLRFGDNSTQKCSHCSAQYLP